MRAKLWLPSKLRERILEGNLPSEQRLNLESDIDQLLGKLNITLEAYPDLKASQNFMLLQNFL